MTRTAVYFESLLIRIDAGAAFATTLFFIAALIPGRGAAEFTMNYTPDNAGTVWTTTSGRFNVPNIPNQTRFAIEDVCCINNYQGPEIVTDPGNGKSYYHVLVGDLVDGFISETYIETDSSVLYGSAGINVHGYGPVSWSRPGSASGVELNDLAYPCCGPQQVQGGNQLRIFSQNAGNGSADPRKVIVRQQLSFSEIAMEFLKDSYDKKPLITMTLDTSEINVVFSADMRLRTYDEGANPIAVANHMTLKGGNAPPDFAAFDIIENSGSSNVTAGQYVYVPGSYAPTAGYGAGAGGVYSYTSGSFDHYNTDWKAFIDPGITNPWSYTQQ